LFPEYKTRELRYRLPRRQIADLDDREGTWVWGRPLPEKVVDEAVGMMLDAVADQRVGKEVQEVPLVPVLFAFGEGACRSVRSNL
jgi:hypothetical protein